MMYFTTNRDSSNSSTSPMMARQGDALQNILQNLRSKSEDTRQSAAAELSRYVETESKERSGESFSRFMDDLHRKIFDLDKNSGSHARVGAILAIDRLIDTDCEENEYNKITRFANYLRNTLSNHYSDPATVQMVAKALGRLARVGASGTLTAEWVESESKRALEWLESKDEGKRYAAVVVLKELAENAPALFYAHVGGFIDVIYNALTDSSIEIREGGVEALRAVLALISERESRWRVDWYHSIFGKAQEGFKNKHAEVLHGSLITIGELLRNTGEFMRARFDEVCELVLRNRDHKSPFVKKAVITLIPQLARFNQETFIQKYLDISINHILGVLKGTSTEKSAAFLAVGQLSMATKDAVFKYSDKILECIKEALIPKNKSKNVTEALACASMLGHAFKERIAEKMRPLLDLMFANGLSQTLTTSLMELSRDIPSLLPSIQDRLLDVISIILARTPYRPPGTPSSYQTSSVSSLHPPIDYNDRGLFTLALSTLGTFDMKGHVLTEFVREHILNYLDDDTPAIRKEAAKTCCKLLINEGEEAPVKGHLGLMVGEALERLLTVGISDPDPTIRHAILGSLDWRFDHYLALAENLRSLFIALNDEVFEIREVTISVIGRLSTRNPAYVLPSLRKTLLQLLTELEFGTDSRNKEESARLLGHLIRAAPRLIKPYIESVLSVLLERIKDPNPAVSTCVLATIGESATVGGEDMIQYLDKLLPLVIETLQDQSSVTKREVAIRTLGQLVQSTGYVITPYTKYPQLLKILMTALKSETAWSSRREIIKVLGIIGAFDPYKQKITQMQAQKSANDLPATGAAATAGVTDILPGIGPSSEDYYPTVAINSLMKILSDPSFGLHHNAAIEAVMFIFNSLKLKCVPFLPQVMPPFLNLAKTCEPGLRKFLFQQFGLLVSIVKQHIRNYLPQLFSLIREFWDSDLQIQIITLEEEISIALNEEFKPYLPELIPQLLTVLQTDPSPHRAALKVLHAFEVFGRHLDDYLYLVIPAVVRLFEQVDATQELRLSAIEVVGRMSKALNFAEYASRIIHPLCRVLAGPVVALRNPAMETLCALVYQLGSDYAIFIPMVRKVLNSIKFNHPKYEDMISRVLKNQELIDLDDSLDGGVFSDRNYASSHSASDDNSGIEVSTKMHVNQVNLKKAWEASQRSTKEDWTEWIRRFSVELLRESPSPALRSCSALASVYYPLARELFNAGFVSCWTELYDNNQEEVVRSLELAFSSPNLPPEVLQTLLNLAEFMEHDDKPLPIDIRALGALAEKCQCYAKALHYKEIEFQTSPNHTIEALIGINNQLQQHEAAIGILSYCQQNHSIELKESWYEKLQRWQDALAAYEKREQTTGRDSSIVLGKMRCLQALGEWEKLMHLCKAEWSNQEIFTGSIMSAKNEVALMGSNAAFNLGRWDFLAQCVAELDENSPESSFFRAMLAIHHNAYAEAQFLIDRTRQLLDTELAALVGESYNRAYEVVIRLQQLSEMEEIITYKKASGEDGQETRSMIKKLWTSRLKGVSRNVEYWQNIMAVRKTVLPPAQDVDNWLKFSRLCIKSGKPQLGLKTLCTLLGMEDPTPQKILLGIPQASSNINSSLSGIVAGTKAEVDPKVAFAYFEYMWAVGDKTNAFQALSQFVQLWDHADTSLATRCYLRLGEWQLALQDSVDEAQIPQIIGHLKASTEYGKDWHKSWHAWALANSDFVSFYESQGKSNSELSPYLVAAVDGFFRSVSLNPELTSSLQDILKLITLWFQYGAMPEVEAELTKGFNSINVDTWLQVIPQIIARVNTNVLPVRRLIQVLLSRVGKAHPQALIYPLTVCAKSQTASRRASVEGLMNYMRKHSPNLVEQAQLVSEELIRVAILWHELWHEGLEEASRLYFGEHNVEGMLAALAPLHKMMDKAETLREISFQQSFGRDLQEAHEWCKKYTRSKKEADLNQAWDLYYHVFRRINKQLGTMNTLELQYVSPKLLEAKNLELAVPGTYRAGEPVVSIASFAPTLNVITSKQRPRRLAMMGSDGKEYKFLLKGHEDLRQDERVMQLFGLVNALLSNDSETSRRELNIQRYSVIPLSANAGLIGWLPNCDTLHQLIRDYRESRKILLNIEHRLMIQMAPDYDNLTLMQKVEVFEYALENTTGQDLYKVLWLKSRNSEVWLERRTNYTRSLAVMSMVGYILGLGDRHPSNLMLERYTGKVVHIDFGDCFEVAMMREKFPEMIPFRLTRMLINAMEVSGIEGNFRSTCESVMRVLRENKDSVMAMLEAFVHDPLINWRLLGNTPSPDNEERSRREAQQKKAAQSSHRSQYHHDSDNNNNIYSLSHQDRASFTASFDQQRPGYPRSVNKERELRQAANEDGGAMPDVLNEKAVAVINRINSKLKGKDFGNTKEPLDVRSQVQRLIKQATSHENLCQCYIGWCAFW